MRPSGWRRRKWSTSPVKTGLNPHPCGKSCSTKPLLDRKGSPQRLGIFETLHDCGNFFYDVLLGIRSHSRTRSKLRWVAHFVPGFQNRRRVIGLLHRTSVGPR